MIEADRLISAGTTLPEDVADRAIRPKLLEEYVGVGGRLRVNSTPINGWDRVLNYADQDVKEMFKDLDADMDLRPLNNIVFRTADKQPQFTIESDHLTEFAADLGVYFNLPLSKRFAMGAKLLAGRSIMQELNLSAHYP